MLEVTPLGKNVLLHLRPISERQFGNITVPDHHSERIRICDVISIGEKVTKVKKGNVVLLYFHNGVDLYLLENHWINQDVRMVSEDEIMAKVKEHGNKNIYDFSK